MRRDVVVEKTPLRLDHSALGGITPQNLEHLEQRPVTTVAQVQRAVNPPGESLRVIDPAAGAPKPLEPGAKLG